MLVLSATVTFFFLFWNQQVLSLPVPRGTTQFTKIFLVGGRCDDPESWYSQWAAAGLKSIDNITKHYCSPFDDGQYSEYTAEFHENAFASAMEAAGNDNGTSLLITGGFFGVDYFDAMAKVLQSGMTVFQGDGVELNFTQYNLSPDQVLYLRMVYEEKVATSTEIGKEICRHKGSKTRLKVAKFYMDARPDLDFRVDNVLASFSRFCPDVLVSEVWSMRGERTQIVGDAELEFAFKETPDLIMTPTDDDAANLLAIAKRILAPEKYDTLEATGWDNNRKDLLDERKILTSADHMVFYPKEGFWKSLGALISAVQTKDLGSTAAIQEQLNLGESASLNSTVLAISSDKAGYVLASLLEAYDHRSAPSSLVNVSTGLYDVSVTNVLAFDGRYDVVFWLQMEWDDPRLAWNPFLYNGTLVIDQETIWHPSLLHFTNEYSQDLIYQKPAIVSYDGHVTSTVNLQSVFLCDTVENVPKFPFDEYQCSMDLGGGGDTLVINHDLGFELISSDPHFATMTSMSIEEDDQGEIIIVYGLYFKRNRFSAWVRLIIPGFLINMIGFMAFWIPSEAVALGITALLCTLAFRETVEIPDTSGITWSEMFMMINVAYQAIAVFVTFCSFCWLGKAINDKLGFLRPRRSKDKDKDTEVTNDKLGFFRPRRAKDKKDETKEDEKNLPGDPSISATVDTSSGTSGDIPSDSRDEFKDKESERGTRVNFKKAASMPSIQSNVGRSTPALPLVATLPVVDPDTSSTLRRRRPDSSTNNDSRRKGKQDPIMEQQSFFDALGEKDLNEEALNKKRECGIDWLGRWYVVPSYILVFIFMIAFGPKVF